ncbi:hypothetical protein F7725_014731 [Dissostichus mawsoni]|uniref:Secreted protein n=1 Tax=Dissostichus mawsoni TaxID=36200 RepID=A0A7J5YWR6_DISMA|nr:hypothetical protein F7725_014731 [Dissostichus mawsoni]
MFAFLILLSFLILISQAISSNLLVIFLQAAMSSLASENLPPPYLTHIPVHKGTLSVHQIKLVVKPSPSLCNSSGVAQHARSPLHLGHLHQELQWAAGS